MGRCIRLLVIFVVAVFIPIGSLQATPKGEDLAGLQEKVASLQLGLGEYYIAHRLTPEQKRKGEKNLQEKSYPGTYTFTDENIHVLAEKDSNMILAVYLKNEEADREQFKQMVADLMMRFGNPTSEAHDQIIYWAYSETGKISEDQYADLKKEGNALIIVTVKFKSKLTFTEVDGEDIGKNSIHSIISSPRLLENFYNK